MNQNRAEAGVSEEEESCSESTESSVEANMLKSRFASLAATLQQTNQNLVTFEYLLENNRKIRQSSQSPKGEGKAETEEDIVNLLKDICGSVNDLRSEIGQTTSMENVKNLDTKQLDQDHHYRGKANKMFDQKSVDNEFIVFSFMVSLKIYNNSVHHFM